MTTTYEAELEQRCESLESEVATLSRELDSYKDRGSFRDVVKGLAKVTDKRSVKQERKKIFNFLVGIMSQSQLKSWTHYEMKTPVGRVVNSNDPDLHNSDFNILVVCFNNRIELRYGEGYNGNVTFKRSFITRSLFPTMGDKLYRLASMIMAAKKEPLEISKKIDELSTTG